MTGARQEKPAQDAPRAPGPARSSPLPLLVTLPPLPSLLVAEASPPLIIGAAGPLPPARSCQWIAADPRQDATKCGAPASGTAPLTACYCARHAARAVRVGGLG